MVLTFTKSSMRCGLCLQRRARCGRHIAFFSTTRRRRRELLTQDKKRAGIFTVPPAMSSEPEPRVEVQTGARDEIDPELRNLRPAETWAFRRALTSGISLLGANVARPGRGLICIALHPQSKASAPEAPRTYFYVVLSVELRCEA